LFFHKNLPEKENAPLQGARKIAKDSLLPQKGK